MPVLGDAACRPVGGTGCSPGFEADPSGWGCRDVVPPEDCPPGSMAVLGDRGCQPVGWTSCPAGFRADPSGWGCEAVVSSAACAAATVERIGVDACVGADDCAQAFPPAGATLFVDGALVTEDATHYRSISGALAVAPAGAVIAIEAGTYAERLVFVRPAKVIGRCAAQVVLTGPGAAATNVGIEVAAVRGVEVRGMTVTAHRGGALVSQGGELTLVSVLVDDNREKGVLATGATSTLRLNRCAVRRTLSAPDGKWGHGAGAQDGASLTLEECVVAGNRNMGLYSSGPGAVLVATSTLVRDTLTSPANDEGYGAFVAGGASLRLERCLLRGNQGMGLLATESSVVTLTDSVVAGTLPNSLGENGLGVYVDYAASARIDRSALVANRIIGLDVVMGGKAQVTDSVIRGTLPRADGRFGHGANVQAQGSTLTMRGTALVDNREMGLIALDAPATATLERCLIRDTRRGPLGLKGLGVGAVAGGGGTLSLSKTALVKNRQAGLVVAGGSLAELDSCVLYGALREPVPDTPLVQGAVAESGGRLVMNRSTVYGNQGVGVYAWGQGGDGGIGSTVEISSSIIRDNRPLLRVPGETGNGAGLLAGDHSRVSLSTSTVTGNTSTGILAEEGAVVNVFDSTLRANVTNADGEGGRGISVQGTSQLSVLRSALVDNTDIALFVADPKSQATVLQSLILRTHADDWGFYGRGVEVVDGQLTLDDCAVIDSRDVAVHVYGPSATGRLARTLIDTVAHIPDGRWGMGAMARSGARMKVDGCWVSRAEGVGVVFSESSAGGITASFLSDNAVGLHVQGAELSVIERVPDEAVAGRVFVSQDTDFADNAVRLGSGAVPLPDPGGSLPQDQKP
ncbi:MAG: right-handed parallel beta-helix repeat-containing protein [Myxococcaceae bacterium]